MFHSICYCRPCRFSQGSCPYIYVRKARLPYALGGALIFTEHTWIFPLDAGYEPIHQQDRDSDIVDRRKRHKVRRPSTAQPEPEITACPRVKPGKRLNNRISAGIRATSAEATIIFSTSCCSSIPGMSIYYPINKSLRNPGNTYSGTAKA